MSVLLRDVGWLVLVAAGFRVLGLFTDFWFDEIFSYEQFARRAASALDIVVGPGFRHDNNHHLNTVILYLVGDRRDWVLYRLPAFAAGLVSVAVSAWIGTRDSRAHGVLSGALVAGSFIMIVYSTEARGYAFVLLFSLLAFATLTRYLDAPTPFLAALFWVWVALGLASHVSIVHFYAAALLWSGYRLRSRLREMTWLHVVPLSSLALWTILVLGGSVAAGGDAWTWRRILDESLAWTIGYPLSTIPVLAACAVGVGLVAWDSWHLRRERGDEGLFYLAVVLGPPMAIAAIDPPFLFPRYFLISLLFLLLVLARALARLWRRPRWGRPVSVLLLMWFIVGNVRHTVPFVRYGRGGASDAVKYLVASTPKSEIRITSPSVDLWSQLPIQFYERAFGLGDRIHLTPRQQLSNGVASAAGFDWIVVPTEDLTGPRAMRIETTSGDNYRLRKDYPAYGPSGLRWLLYQRETEGAVRR